MHLNGTQFNLLVFIASIIGSYIAYLLEAYVFWFLLLLFSFYFLIFIFYRIYQNAGYSSVYKVVPTLQLASALVQTDKRVDEKEKRKIQKLLENEFGEKLAKKYGVKFNDYLSQPIKIHLVCRTINKKFTQREKINLIRFLVSLSVSDRFLSKEEEKFLLQVFRRLRIPASLLKSILALHNYISENEANYSRTKAPSNSTNQKKSYEILGLEPNASMEDVKDAYRNLAKIYHPDKATKTENKEKAKEQFQIIVEAYEKIKNKK